jgi:REP element-mobilizing transposase RayT
MDVARQARKASETGIYHVMIRGINYQRIFEDEEDHEKYLRLLQIYRKRCGFALYGYCLMGNHVHLLIKEAARPSVMTIRGEDVEVGPGEPLDSALKRIGVSYVLYFNRKYKRVGHLFQDRFRSEPVENDVYLLMALRYIHRNPVKARMCEKPEDYPDSSYRAYLNGNDNGLTDTGFVLEIQPRDQMKQFTEQENEDRFIDIEPRDYPKTDEEAKTVMLKLSGCATASEFQRLEREKRKDTFRELHRQGMNIAQLGRITGYTRKAIYRALGE